MEQDLKHVVAELFETDLHKVNADFVLSTRRMQGSLARAKLDAAIRHRLGIKSRAVYVAKTYGELETAICETSSDSENAVLNVSRAEVLESSSEMSSISFSGTIPGLKCGIDIEMVEGFPVVADYWKDSFYANSFSSAEIAYCLLQQNPPMHFAARWCAKEALKKCEPSYLFEEMNNLELLSSNGGPPIFRHYQNGVPVSLPFSVSISHTPLMAVAIAIKQV